MARFSKKTITRLKEAGWKPNRRINIDDIISEFKQNGFLPVHVLEDFLLEFYNLKLVYSNGDRLFSFEDLGLTHEQCISYIATIGKEVYPIGEMGNSNFFLFISEDGMIYALTEDHMFLIGRTIDEGIEFICTSALKNWKNMKQIVIQTFVL